jgi:YD repeat-containing protein
MCRASLGKLTSFRPDSASGAIVEVGSDYTDQPGVLLELDPYSRVKLEWLKPTTGGSDLKSRELVYTDDGQPAFVEEKAFTGNGEEFIRTATVTNGFGGTWKTISETPGESGIAYMGMITYRDAETRTVRETYPLDCGEDALCSQYDGQDEPLATVTESDALGRTIAVNTPDGVSHRSYRSATRTQPAGPGTSNPFDVALASNGKGDLVERWLDGDRVVWVNECHAGVAPGEELTGAGCGAYDQTFYTYEATGEISTIYDAAATAGNAYADPDHYLRYSFDTLGRVVRIDDPDGGMSETEYDDAGNVLATINGQAALSV